MVIRMGKYRKRRRKDIEGVIKLLVYPPVIVAALLIRAAKRQARPCEDIPKRAEYSTICLSEKELKIIKKIIENSNKYSWKNVEDIHRLGRCNPYNGEQDRNSSCYGYRVFYDDGYSRLITIAKEHVED